MLVAGGMTACVVTAASPAPTHSAKSPKPQAQPPAQVATTLDWTTVSGAHFQGLGGLDGWQKSVAVDASRDGAVIVGFSSSQGIYNEPVRWTSDAPQGLTVPDVEGARGISTARAISSDGQYVAGSVRGMKRSDRAIRWSADGAHLILNQREPFRSMEPAGISEGGKVVVGFGRAGYGCLRQSNCYQPFIAKNGIATPLLDSGKEMYGQARGVSNDGAIVAGTLTAKDGGMAFVWQDGSVKKLGSLPGATTSMAHAISGNGKVVVGRSYPNAFRWEADKMENLGNLGLHDQCVAHAVSENGSRVIGSCGSSKAKVAATVFVWQRDTGMRELSNVLSEEYGIDLSGWKVTSGFGVSGDGRVIVGDGYNPEGTKEAWVAVLPL